MAPTIKQSKAKSKDASDKQTVPACHIVSPNTMQAQLLKSYLIPRFEIDIVCHRALSFTAVIDEIPEGHCIYLLDCLSMDPAAIKTLLNTGSALPPGHIMIALYNVVEHGDLASLVKHHRIRGVFYKDGSLSTFVKGLKTLFGGHLWLTRKLLADCTLLSDQRTDTNQSVAALASLTRRETEVLKRVMVGESNQEIADAMRISLHTVKTHLYNTFKKINVPNRLQGALWAATNLGKHLSK